MSFEGDAQSVAEKYLLRSTIPILGICYSNLFVIESSGIYQILHENHSDQGKKSDQQ